MSNLPWPKLDRSDRTLREALPVGMEDGVKQIVLRVCGFELFNTRSYHNYETWSDGYAVVSRRDGKAMAWEEAAVAVRSSERDETYLWSRAEDMDEACAKSAAALKAHRARGNAGEVPAASAEEQSL